MSSYKDYLPNITEYLSFNDIPLENREILKNAYLNSIRIKRNELLIESDKYLLPDFPISSDKLELIKIYRQELRDLLNYLDKIINNDNIINFTVNYPKFPL